jgi:branched-chain amino acid transport system ATP-binding protein
VRAVETRGLYAGYRGTPAVRQLTLTVDEGEVVALLGPNGAGKTTTLLALAGVLAPIRGQITVLGRPVTGRRPHVVARRGVALVPEDRGLFYQLTVGENLRLCRRRDRRTTLPDVVDLFPALAPLMHRRAGLLSGGEQQMLGIARALLAGPRVLMIDELSLGLAPMIVSDLLAVVRRVASERSMAVLLVEQHVHLALQIADRAYVLRHGELALHGSAAELRERHDLLEASYLGDAGLGSSDIET